MLREAASYVSQESIVIVMTILLTLQVREMGFGMLSIIETSQLLTGSKMP